MKQLIADMHAESHLFTVTEAHQQQRLDQFLHEQLTTYSRSFFQVIIKQGGVTLNGQVVTKAGHRLKAGDQIICQIPRVDFDQSAATIDAAQLQGIDVTLIAQEPDFLIINKPAGLVVHKPAHTSTRVTLVDWILAHYPALRDIGSTERPGIVHRLDMQTSGLMIIPRTPAAHAQFTHLFKERLIKKTYLALVEGHPPAQATIDYRITRHPTERTKMAHSRLRGRTAVTHFEVVEYLRNAALIKALPETGRTHQIRVHCTAWGHPILGDNVYGNRSKIITRQSLHAAELSFDYNKKAYSFSAPLPEDMQQARHALADMPCKN